MRNIWLEFVRNVGEGWAWFWAPWRAVCALLDRITGAAQEIALLEQRLASAEFERDEYAKHVIVCSCCGDFIPPSMPYETQYVDGDVRLRCEACCPRCSSCGEDIAEDEGTRRVIFASNDPSQDDVVAVTCAACERGVWHCGGCGTAYEARVDDCAGCRAYERYHREHDIREYEEAQAIDYFTDLGDEWSERFLSLLPYA